MREREHDIITYTPTKKSNKGKRAAKGKGEVSRLGEHACSMNIVGLVHMNKIYYYLTQLCIILGN